jgi:hypothetical protein
LAYNSQCAAVSWMAGDFLQRAPSEFAGFRADPNSSTARCSLPFSIKGQYPVGRSSFWTEIRPSPRFHGPELDWSGSVWTEYLIKYNYGRICGLFLIWTQLKRQYILRNAPEIVYNVHRIGTVGSKCG